MRKIRWDKQAAVELRQALSFIRKDSPQNAEKVKDEIIDLTISLARYP